MGQIRLNALYVDTLGQFRTIRQLRLLRAEISALASREKEIVYFHACRDPLGVKSPSLLLECDDAFFERIRQLSLFGRSEPVWAGVETFRAGHAGPVDPNHLKRLLARPEKEKNGTKTPLSTTTWRLHDDILELAKSRRLEGQVLIRHVDGERGFISLLCPDDFISKIKKLPRCKALVGSGEAHKIFHPKP